MPTIKFTKMHGLGNDFVLFDLRRRKFPSLAKKARLICDRHFGVGCDQIITIEPSPKADYRMRIFNADGSQVEMCGNGIRCFAKYLWDHGEVKICKNKFLDVETKAGIIRPRIVKKDMVEVDMGEPILDGLSIPTTFEGKVIDKAIRTRGVQYNITAVSMGNPHSVIFTDDVDGVDLEKVGSTIEHLDIFPNRVNVEFAQVISKNRLKVRVWERGSGITLACGTGACAVVVASALNGHTGRKVRVDLPGGALGIEWTKNNHLLMRGSATEVYSGELNL